MVYRTLCVAVSFKTHFGVLFLHIYSITILLIKLIKQTGNEFERAIPFWPH